MEQFAQLGSDMVRLWSQYSGSYLNGIKNTLILAVVATLIGCLIGFVCGVLNTIPYTKSDSLPKRFLLKLIRIIVRVYVEIFRGTPMVLQAVFIYYGLPYFSNNALRFDNIWAAAILIVSINTGAIWRKPSGAALSPSTPARPRAPRHRHDPCADHALCDSAPGPAQYHAQIGNNLIINIKDSCVLSVIGVAELLYKTKAAAGALYMNFETYTIT